MTTRIVCDDHHPTDQAAVARVTCYFKRGNTVSGIKSWDSCEEHLTSYLKIAWAYAASEEGMAAAKDTFDNSRANEEPYFVQVTVTPYATVAAVFAA